MLRIFAFALALVMGVAASNAVVAQSPASAGGAPDQIVQGIADDLGFDGALGTVCEVVDGRYTGKALRALHAQAKADAIRSLDHDLAASTAYSDSHTDLPFLEAVGSPVVVNPDRALRRIAGERGWPVLEFGRKSSQAARERRLPQ